MSEKICAKPSTIDLIGRIKLLFNSLVCLLAVYLLVLPLMAVPRYISYSSLYDSEPLSIHEGALIAQSKALQLAKLLDQAKWYDQIIRTTVVLNYNDGEFFIVATLGNGESVKLYTDLIAKASLTGNLALVNNRFIVFPFENRTMFEVFDKTEFYNQAINAQYFKKIYPMNHPLGGKTFFYRLKRFDVSKTSQYKLELDNGSVIDLDFLSAYKSLVDSLLVDNVGNVSYQIFGKSNIINSVKSFSKSPYNLPGVKDDSLKTFGVHLSFDEPFNYRISDIGIQINRSEKNSSLDFIIPNSKAIKNISIGKQDNLEYISHYNLISNSEEAFTIIRAHFFNKNFDTLDLMWYQPSILLHKDRKNIFFVFYHDPLQVINYGVYNWTESQLKIQERVLSQSIEMPRQNVGSRFYIMYAKAVAHYNESLKINDWQLWIDEFKIVVDQANAAAAVAENDAQLKQALNVRNRAIDHIFNAYLVNDIYPLLNKYNFSNDPSILENIKFLGYFTRAHAAKESFIDDVRTLYDIDKSLYLLRSVLNLNKTHSASDIAKFKQIVNEQLNKIAKLSSTNQEIKKIKNRLQLLGQDIKRQLN